MKELSVIVVTAISCLLIVGGCASTQEVNLQKLTETQKDTRADRLNEIVMKSGVGTAKHDLHAEYIIGPEDILEIEVFQAEEMRKTVRVSSQGFISLPLVGQMKAGGLSPVALEEEMARKLEKYFVDPVVSVYVKEYRSAKIGVMGAVKQPQVFAVTGQKNLLEMLSMAGGLAPDASSLCYVMRTAKGEDGSSNTETVVIDLDALLEQGNTALNMSLHGGDMIHVPKGGVVYVDGAVEKPGVFPLTPKTTLMRALAMAGGIRFEADKSDIKLIRETGKGVRDVLTFDYDSVKDGGREDILVKEGDIIVVSRSGIKTFLTTIMRGAFSFGGGSVGLGGIR